MVFAGARRGRTGAIAVAVITLVLCAGAGQARAATCPWMNTSLSPQARTQMLLGAMSMSQKISMTSQTLPDGVHFGAAGYLPAIPSLCIPPLVFNDAGQGVADVQVGATAFPTPIAQSASWNPAEQYQFGQALGDEAWEKGIDVQLAPGIETDRNPMNGRTWEYMSEDPYLSGQAGSAIVRGIQSQHVIVTIKHFIANSQETDRMTDSADVSKRTLEEMYAPQYDVAIHQGGAMGVMCSYNRINSVYSCQNPETLKGILDTQFGFTGMVVSDWGATHSTVDSAMNGLDIEMNITPGTYYGSPLEKAVEASQVPIATLNDMVSRILLSMFTVGVFDHPPAAQPQAFLANVSSAAHVQLARQISEDGTVLLKDTDRILPLSGKDKTIAVIGTSAGQAGAEASYEGEGSGHVPLAGEVAVVSPQTGIAARATAAGDTVDYQSGNSISAAVSAARAASVAVVVVSNWMEEGTDLSSLNLGDNPLLCVSGATPCIDGNIDQDALIADVAGANPNTIVVLQTGGPVLMPWLSRVKGVLEAWYPGQEDGNALAGVLFGDVDPSAKLPITFPASQSRMPLQSKAQWPGIDVAGDTVGPHSSYSEGLLVGYRWYDAKHVAPLFPFGFGLTYTSFRFSSLTVRRTRTGASASFVIKNTGTVAGADVAQVYVGDPKTAGEPPLQLKGYQREQLNPGQSTRVTIPLSEVAFSHWSNRLSTWVVTKGTYAISVGDSSANLPLHAALSRGRARLAPGVY